MPGKCRDRFYRARFRSEFCSLTLEHGHDGFEMHPQADIRNRTLGARRKFLPSALRRQKPDIAIANAVDPTFELASLAAQTLIPREAGFRMGYAHMNVMEAKHL